MMMMAVRVVQSERVASRCHEQNQGKAMKDAMKQEGELEHSDGIQHLGCHCQNAPKQKGRKLFNGRHATFISIERFLRPVPLK